MSLRKALAAHEPLSEFPLAKSWFTILLIATFIFVPVVAVVFFFYDPLDHRLFTKHFRLISRDQISEYFAAIVGIQAAFVSITVGLGQLFVSLPPLIYRPYVMPGRVVSRELNWRLYVAYAIGFLLVNLALYWAVPGFISLGLASILTVMTILWQLVLFLKAQEILQNDSLLVDLADKYLRDDLKRTLHELRPRLDSSPKPLTLVERLLYSIPFTSNYKKTKTQVIDEQKSAKRDDLPFHPFVPFYSWISRAISDGDSHAVRDGLVSYAKLIEITAEEREVNRGWDIDLLLEAPFQWYAHARSRNESEQIAYRISQAMLDTYFTANENGIDSRTFYSRANFQIAKLFSGEIPLKNGFRTEIKKAVIENTALLLRDKLFLTRIQDKDPKKKWELAQSLLRKIGQHQIRKPQFESLRLICDVIRFNFDEDAVEFSCTLGDILLEFRAYIFHLWNNKALGADTEQNDETAKQLLSVSDPENYGTNLIERSGSVYRLFGNLSSREHRISQEYPDVNSSESGITGGSYIVTIDSDFRMYAYIEFALQNRYALRAASRLSDLGPSSYLTTIRPEDWGRAQQFMQLMGLSAPNLNDFYVEIIQKLDERESNIVIEQPLAQKRLDEFKIGLSSGVQKFFQPNRSIKAKLISVGLFSRKEQRPEPTGFLGLNPIALPKEMFLENSPSGSYFVQANGEFIRHLVRAENEKIVHAIHSSVKEFTQVPEPEKLTDYILRLGQSTEGKWAIISNRLRYENMKVLQNSIAPSILGEVNIASLPRGVFFIETLNALTVDQHNFEYQKPDYPVISTFQLGLLDEITAELGSSDETTAKQMQEKHGGQIWEYQKKLFLRIAEDFDVVVLPEKVRFINVADSE